MRIAVGFEKHCFQGPHGEVSTLVSQASVAHKAVGMGHPCIVTLVMEVMISEKKHCEYFFCSSGMHLGPIVSWVTRSCLQWGVSGLKLGIYTWVEQRLRSSKQLRAIR